MLDIGRDYNHNVVLIVIGEFEFLIFPQRRTWAKMPMELRCEVIETAGGPTCSLGALYDT
jgi:hypothetical protein